MKEITLSLILGLISVVSSESPVSASLDFFIKHAGFHRFLFSFPITDTFMLNFISFYLESYNTV